MQTACSIPRLATLIFVLAIGASLLVTAIFSEKRARQQPEFAQSADRFGYLQMAADLRRGTAPHGLLRFTAGSEHARALIAFLQSEKVPIDNSELFGPNAYHYVENSNQILCQYPPGTARMLSLLPEGRAVYMWQVAAIALILFFAAASAVRALNMNLLSDLAAFASTGLLATATILLIGFSVSYSIDLLCIPLLVAVFAAVAAQRTAGRRQQLLAGVAGAAFGWCIVIRVAAGLLLPGFIALFWPRRVRHPLASGLPAFLAGFLLAGLLPLMLHQHELTGSFFHSTYTPTDAALPTLATFGDNLRFYTLESGGELFWIFVAGMAAFALLLWSDRGVDTCQNPRPRIRILTMLFWFLMPTGYFLLHRISTPYYQLPTLLTCIAALAAFSQRTPSSTRDAAADSSTDSVTPPPSSQGISAWLAAILCAATVLITAATLPGLNPDSAFRVPSLALPEPLKNTSAWILGDRLDGTLWYYHGIQALHLNSTDPATRRLIYRFIHDRKEPLYFLRDTPNEPPLILRELEALGARTQIIGTFLECPVLQIDWPETGPL